MTNLVKPKAKNVGFLGALVRSDNKPVERGGGNDMKSVENSFKSLESMDRDAIRLISLDQIQPDPGNPRKTFDEEHIRELAQTIKEQGLLQPVTVRTVASGYMLIWGERRYRACKMAGLTEIAAKVDDSMSIEQIRRAQITENAAREDMLPIELARSIQDLANTTDTDFTTAAKSVGMSNYKASLIKSLVSVSPEVEALSVKGVTTDFRTLASAQKLLDRDKNAFSEAVATLSANRGSSVRDHFEAALSRATNPSSKGSQKKSSSTKKQTKSVGSHITAQTVLCKEGVDPDKFVMTIEHSGGTLLVTVPLGCLRRMRQDLDQI